MRKVDLEKTFLRFWQNLPKDLRALPVYVAVSGGGDSTALASVSLRLKAHFPSLHWMHVNYRLRRPDSDREEAYLRSWAQAEGIALHVLRLNPRSKPKNLQAWARERRHRFFAEVFRKFSAGKGLAVLAHHEQDQAETVLLRLIRGAGLRGLGGMEVLERLEVRLPKAVQPLWLFRPFLSVPKEAIQRYQAVHRLQFFEDRSNRSPLYTRNRVRNQILPLLSTENPRIVEALCELATGAAQAAAALDHWAQSELIKNFKKNRKPTSLTIDIFKKNPAGLGTFLLENFFKFQGWEGESLKRQLPRLLHALAFGPFPQVVPFKRGKRLAIASGRLRVVPRAKRGIS